MVGFDQAAGDTIGTCHRTEVLLALGAEVAAVTGPISSPGRVTERARLCFEIGEAHLLVEVLAARAAAVLLPAAPPMVTTVPRSIVGTVALAIRGTIMAYNPQSAF